jgi:DNA-binding NarL/FixJ family response regulator
MNERMNKQITIVVIATRSIPLSDGLDALLKAIPEIERVEIVRTLENALQRVEDIKPRIILLDLALAGKQPEACLSKISVLSPETLRVLLVDDVLDMKWQPQFAKAVLIKGALPSAVATILNDLLVLKGKEHQQAQGTE